MPTSCVYLLYNSVGFCYIGQTTDIRQRLYLHRSNFKNDGKCSSKFLGPDWDCQILEELDTEDLRDAEKFYYEFWSELCPGMLVNKCKPGRPHSESVHKYQAKNRDCMRANQRLYNAQNRDEIYARKKLKYAQNRDEINAQRKLYHAQNRDEINAKRKLKYAQKKNNLIKELN